MDVIQILNCMNITIDTLNMMRMDAYHKHGAWLLKNEPNALNVFSILDKVTTVPLELLGYYRHIWRVPSNRPSEHDMEERIEVITRMCYISFLSIVEYFMKDCLRKTRSGPILPWYKKKKKSGYISFGGILSESKKKNIISSSEYDIWDGTRSLRNALVHNNGIADFDKIWDIDGTIVKFRKDNPIRKKLWAYSKIIDTLSLLTRKWAEKYLGLHSIS